MNTDNIFTSMDGVLLLKRSGHVELMETLTLHEYQSKHFPKDQDPVAAIKKDMAHTLTERVIKEAPEGSIVAFIRHREDEIGQHGKVSWVEGVRYRGRFGSYTYASIETCATVDYYRMSS